MYLLNDHHKWNEYRAIAIFYGLDTANRSKIPLINHIEEGLLVMIQRNASEDAMKAFCLHPLCQNDKELKTFDPTGFSVRAVMFVMEYRQVANRHLLGHSSNIVLSVLDEVNEMLIADKVQNYKDFMFHHFGTHAKSAELKEYFHDWHRALGLTVEQVEQYQTILGVTNET